MLELRCAMLGCRLVLVQVSIRDELAGVKGALVR